MSDEIRRHAPTPRRLERLRQAGVTGASEAVTAVAVLAGATVGLALLGGRLCGWLGGVLARDLQNVVAGPTDLVGLLTGRLLQAGAVVVAVSAATMAVAVMAQVAQGRFPQRSSKQMYLPMGTDGGARRRRSPALTLGPGLVGLGAGTVLLHGWLHGLASQTAWLDGAALGAALGVWWRWLVVLGAVALIHAVGVRLRMLSQAQMSEREMREERRQTEGSWLKRRRVNEWLRRRL